MSGRQDRFIVRGSDVDHPMYQWHIQRLFPKLDQDAVPRLVAIQEAQRFGPYKRTVEEYKLWVSLAQEAIDRKLIDPPERTCDDRLCVSHADDSPGDHGVDGYLLRQSDPTLDIQHLIDRYYRAVERKASAAVDAATEDRAKAEAKRLIKDAPSNPLLAVLARCGWLKWKQRERLDAFDFEGEENARRYGHTLRFLLCQILRHRRVADADAIEHLLRLRFGSLRSELAPEDMSIVAILRRSLEPAQLNEVVRGYVVRLRDHYASSLAMGRGGLVPARRMYAELEELLGEGDTLPLVPGEVWSDTAIDRITTADDHSEARWRQLLRYAQTADGAAPNARWLTGARRVLDLIEVPDFNASIAEWFPLVDRGRTRPYDGPRTWPNPDHVIAGANADVLKGLAWISSLAGGNETARALRSLAEAAFRKMPQIGPRCAMLGNACLWALGQLPSDEALPQFAMLRIKIRNIPAQKLIEKALTTTAARLGVPRDEIEEMGVPAYGMEEVGVRREQLGDVTAEVAVVDHGGVELRWFKADGKRVKSVPASVKADHAEDLKELKAAAKDIERMLPAQRDRIDNLFLAQKSWPIATWRERYLDHPLVGTLARRLIWTFTDDDARLDGAWHDGAIVGHDDRALQLTDGARVELWHPIGRPVDEVLAWRGWLERHEVKQPFKQAHREVYVLTDAERNTRVYSNRYAAHLLKQHQFNALCAARGWKNQLRLMVDADYPPAHRALPKWGLRAEFWIEGAGDNFGADTNETGTFLYVATDQVRFYPLDAAQLHGHASGGGYEWSRYRGEAEPQPIPLDEVPPLVFSEIMRDVDLFVGVASVGNDANWLDQAARPERRDYWHSYSFGDLSGTALTRKAVLERVIPRLKIAPRCSFDDKFLRVRGDRRAYKIHLGSGNILMEPNDQYLCIVPRSSAVDAAGGKVFLPFEGDRTLSIILSKAFLLAEDQKIQDPTITRQIAQ